MSNVEDNALVRSYLRQLDIASSRLPEGRRSQLRSELMAHLEEAIDPEMSDGDVACVIRGLGDPGAIVREEVADAPTLRRSWIVGGALMVGSLAVGYVLPQLQVVAADVPLGLAVWGAGVIVLAVGAHSITARRPLGTAALLALAVWAVGSRWVSSLVGRGSTAAGEVPSGLVALTYVEDFVGFLIACIAVIQVARIEVVPRPWRWAPTWVLGAVAVVWIMNALLGVTGETGVSELAYTLGALGSIVSFGDTLVLGILAIALGAGVLRRRTHEPSDA